MLTRRAHRVQAKKVEGKMPLAKKNPVVKFLVDAKKIWKKVGGNPGNQIGSNNPCVRFSWNVLCAASP